LPAAFASATIGTELNEALMELNADFSQRVAVHAARLPWVAAKKYLSCAICGGGTRQGTKGAV
jgi:hypothetical protein